MNGVSIDSSFPIVVALHRQLKLRCDQDFVVAVLVTGLTRRERNEEAAQVLNEYLVTGRREDSYLLPSLFRLASELQVDVPGRYATEFAAFAAR
jgi:hypothetical protein